MPIYEYQCEGCQQIFEVFQHMNDPAPEKHDCGSTQVHRVLSRSNFKLEGTGWYATDYANKEKPVQSSAETKAAPATPQSTAATTTSSSSTASSSPAATKPKPKDH